MVSRTDAMTLAERLVRHPKVEVTRYPGLSAHPTHEAARRQLKGFGTIISFDVLGDVAAVDAVCARLQLIQHATSLGAVESTIERRACIPGQEHLPPDAAATERGYRGRGGLMGGFRSGAAQRVTMWPFEETIMTGPNRIVVSIGLLLACSVAVASGKSATESLSYEFDAKAAAAYLDARAEWWTTWPNAQRDRGTFCNSCHTTLPYALARPELRTRLGERQPSVAESKILNNLLIRARSWREVEPFYPDQTRGIPKTSESRAIEAVMNALVISRRDAGAGHLSDDARTAFEVMWSLQMKTGPNSGAWTWLNFNYEPWESPNSPYFGASLAAIAIGSAPDGYAVSPEVQERMKALRGYFARQHMTVSILNQLMGLWASGTIPDLLTPAQRKATIDAVFRAQQVDGGWSTSSLGSYQRVDKTPNDTTSDGYATALACLALQAVGVEDARITRGLHWLRQNQDRPTGRWTATSLNKARDPESDPAKFMDDAATAYAVLALTYERK